MAVSLLKQRGYLAFLAVVIIVIIGFLGVAISRMLASSASAVLNYAQANQAFYLAEGGLEYATRMLLNPTFASRLGCSNIVGNANATNITYSGAAGVFSITGATLWNPQTISTLGVALGAADTTITTGGTIPTGSTGYAPAGRLVIDKEHINYGTISGSSFIGVTRGVDNTTAIAHVVGTPVSQYQCDITATAGIANLTSPQAKHVVKEGIELQDGWLGGSKTGSSINFARFNNPELTWTYFAPTLIAPPSINGIALISYVDGWAVGDDTGGNMTALHWNGSSWTLATTFKSTDVFRGIACVATNYCWAVGDKKAFAFWNGSTWASGAALVNASVPSVTLNGVNCPSASDCWAVGNISTNDVMIHWNGTIWSRDPSTPTSPSNLNSVYCINGNDCWAVGNSRHFIHWNGASWGTVATDASVPNVGFQGVYCNNASDCWAVGASSSGDVFVHWNGSTWTRDASRPALAVNLRAVACANSNDCWAAGASSGLFHWNGTSWVQVAISGGIPSITLNAIALISPNQQPESAWQEVFA